jgi:CheY-like chemotaxis protein
MADRMPPILIADDDPDTRDALRIVLEDAGYAVLEAGDGVATLDALLLSTTPLVVLLDVLMPRLSGYEVLLQVAGDPLLRAHHAYIVLSAAQLTDVRVGPRFSELVAQLSALVVPKPFDIDEVLRCVAHQSRQLGAPGAGGANGDESQTG